MMHEFMQNFLSWFGAALALSLNAILLMGVYRVMQDRHEGRAAVQRDGKPNWHVPPRAACIDEEALRNEARSWVKESEIVEALSERPPPQAKPQFRMPEMKVESSFGSGNLGKRGSSEG